jgi:hypothetical protein
LDRFETLLRCPDCHGPGLERNADNAELTCRACTFRAVDEGGVFNLLPSEDRKELYPGDRDDAVDCSIPGHERRLRSGWHDLEGPYGNKYRWIGAQAEAILKPVHPGPLRLRLRGFAPEELFAAGAVPVIEAAVNGAIVGRWSLDRLGLFVFEADVPDAERYVVEIRARPTWKAVGDERLLTVNLSMLRLIPRQE